MMKLNEKLAHLRKETGLSQVELAEELGISRQTISKWESGITIPSPENLIRLGELYRVSVGSLLDEESKIQRVKEQEEKEQSGATAEQPRKKIKFQTLLVAACVIILLVVMHVMIYVTFFKPEEDRVYLSKMDTMMIDMSTATRFSMD